METNSNGGKVELKNGLAMRMQEILIAGGYTVTTIAKPEKNGFPELATTTLTFWKDDGEVTND